VKVKSGRGWWENTRASMKVVKNDEEDVHVQNTPIRAGAELSELSCTAAFAPVSRACIGQPGLPASARRSERTDASQAARCIYFTGKWYTAQDLEINLPKRNFNNYSRVTHPPPKQFKQRSTPRDYKEKT
jgi:hypothetical protein